MKKILIVFLLLVLYSLGFAQYRGDGLGNRTDEFEQLQTDVNDLSAGLISYYFTDETPTSVGYWLMQDTVPAGAESTITADMDAATVVIATFTTESQINFTSLRSGFYNMFFYASKSTVNRDVRLRFEVYRCTGTAETFLFSSSQSNLITTDKAFYTVNVATNEIAGNGCINFIGIKVLADVTGAAAAPVLTFYMEGTNATSFSMPGALSDIGVTRIIAGTDIDITYTGASIGRGDVTINSDALSKSSGTEISSNIDRLDSVETSTGNLEANKYSQTGGAIDGDIDFQDTHDINNLSSLNMNSGSGQHWGADGTIDLFGGGDLVGISNYLKFSSDFEITEQLFTDVRIGTYTLRIDVADLQESTSTANAYMYYDNIFYGIVLTTDVRTGEGVNISTLTLTEWLMGVSLRMGGHDITGADNIEAQSYTCSDGTVFTSTDAFDTGGVGGNSNREYHWRAGQFTLPTEASAPAYLDEYDIAGTSYPCTVLQFSSSTDKNAFTHVKWTPEYDDGNITVYLDYFTTIADSGQIEWNIDVSTTTNRRATGGAWTNKAFGDFPGSTVAYDVMTATLTITANKPVDDKQYWMRLWLDVSDSTIIQIVNLMEMRIDYDVD